MNYSVSYLWIIKSYHCKYFMILNRQDGKMNKYQPLLIFPSQTSIFPWGRILMRITFLSKVTQLVNSSLKTKIKSFIFSVLAFVNNLILLYLISVTIKETFNFCWGAVHLFIPDSTTTSTTSKIWLGKFFSLFSFTWIFPLT